MSSSLRYGTIVLALITTALAAAAPSCAAPTVPLKIVNWNVLYGFNHAQSIEQGAEWIARQTPDVVALQELNGNTAESLQTLAQQWGHAHSAILKQDGFPVGLTSAAPIEVIERRVEGFHHGYLHCRTHGIHFFVVHFWPTKPHEAAVVLDKIRPLLAQRQRVVLLGDFNSHSRRDAEFLAKRTSIKPLFDVIDSVEAEGLVDLVHKHAPQAMYSCPSPITIPKWSADLEVVKSKRQRIDFVFADPGLAQHSTLASIVSTEEVEKVSDHYPLTLEFAIPLAKEPSKINAADFAFGVIADCQYCDAPTAGNRHYALSPRKLEHCVSHLNTMDLAYAIHLGDFIDRDFESFAVVKPIYNQLQCAKYHVLGNHDFSVADEKKAGVRAELGMPANYYDFVVKGWRFIVLDGNDISFHAYTKESDKYRDAEAYYKNRGITAPKWNGAIGTKQLQWLDEVLTRATEAGENAVLYCHFPVFPEDVHNLWNAKEVIETIKAHACVKAYVNGHNHAGNYGLCDGVHYLTMKGMVDSKQTAYAAIHVFDDRLEVVGYGREKDRTLIFR